ncbi:conserved hypothetical protein [Ricinus communis]|uniref:Uncharacterized protein n=1 Tax=Ricinus communis TaxID=3988 RepID=B9SYP8_RICCO|nr:conserved hypothetical protein [Ricinus communis]|eukprot:XP_002531117.1 uncharacterized protein LOC8286115 isoform X1 [Ricinus communis]
MEELGSLWSYQEGVDELKQKLLCTAIELETLKVEASEAIRKHKEDMKHLLDLLKIAYRERDEAKDQLQKLLSKLMPTSTYELHPIIPQAQPESPLVLPMKANSSITESNSLSDTYNHQSHGSSPVDSFFDAVTSPDFSSINMADSSCINLVNKTYVQEYSGSMSTGLVAPLIPKIDPADAAFDNLVTGKVLPEQGKLLQAVTEAGPLLQTLLVAGPLPRWRNPPPLQSFRIPPVSIKGCENSNIVTQKLAANAKSSAKKPVNLTSYPDMSRGSSHMCSASMLNFTSGASGSGLGSGWSLNSDGINQIPAGKRQRFH